MQAYTAEQLADLKLPGFPSTREGWRLRVMAENWECVEEKSRGRGGIKRLYIPPEDVAALIQKRLRGDLPPAESRPAADANFSMQMAGALPGPAGAAFAELAALNSGLLEQCLKACEVVYGEVFMKEPARVQMRHASNLYILLNSLVAPRAAAGASMRDYLCLEDSGFSDLLRLMLKLRWLQPYVAPGKMVLDEY